MSLISPIFNASLLLGALSVSAVSIADSKSHSPAEDTEQELQDMSDPLAVYTQAGVGVTNKGLNLKVGQTYDTGNANTMAMNIIEVKGFAGEALGWDGSSQRDDSVDSIRFRNFGVDLSNGRGSQLDVSYDIGSEMGSASYSFIQALPKFGPVQFYPLAGAGVAFANNYAEGTADHAAGYSVPGTFALVGTYSKITITDKIWLNYNPMWMSSLSGSDFYKDNAFGIGNSDVFAHEFAASYQINARANIRYFANWTEYSNFQDGDHRVEFNYQF
ncbi:MULTISPECIES: hypothetical protein [unclassified Agarivorans]|nr:MULTISPECIES: hypothetical protein [unclassified Agarivorans]MDO6686518.1 hypothetical protein [Agarivorans sp. 3_MG-2023]MDO6715336.1 hypothetical protein [Agarivorans sp. 2_MG-2023]